MKVAVVSDYAALSGGITVFLDNLTQHLSTEVDFTLVAWQDGRRTPDVAIGEIESRFEAIALVSNGDILSAASLTAKADIVFLQTSWNVRLLAVMAGGLCRSLGIPLVTVVHTTSHSSHGQPAVAIQEAWLCDLLQQSARVICVSEDVRRSLEQLGSAKLEVIGNASRFLASDENHGSPTRAEKVITYVGRTGYAKGVDDFFRIAEDLHDTGLKFVCNGLYPDIESYATLAPDNVELCHSLNAHGMFELFNRSHAVVATYRRSEGLPLALLEALSLAVPVLGYGSPGVRKLLELHNQFVVPVGDYRKIARRIRSWWSSGAAFTPPIVEQVPHWSGAARQYLAMFRTVAA